MNKTFLLILFVIGLSMVSQPILAQEIFHAVSLDDDEAILKVYKNPENNFTLIDYRLEEEGNFSIDILNATGRMVDSIPIKFVSNKIISQEIDTRYYRPGTYFFRVNSLIKKMVFY